MSKKLLEGFLKQYIANYTEDKFKLSFLTGTISFRDLIISKEAINQLMDEINYPFKLKFGVVKKLVISGSYLYSRLDEILIEDLIVVFAPDPSKADRNFRLTPQQRTALLAELIQKYISYIEWKVKSEQLYEELLADSKHGKTSKSEKLLKRLKNHIGSLRFSKCSSVPSRIYEEMLREEKEHFNAFSEYGPLIYETPEEKWENLYSAWQSAQQTLEAKIRVKQLRIFYEDTRALTVVEDKKLIMTFGLRFDEVILERVPKPEGCIEFHDTFRLNISKISLESNQRDARIVPEWLHSNLSEFKDVQRIVEYFDKFIAQSQDKAFLLSSVSNFSITFVIGMKSKTKKTSFWSSKTTGSLEFLSIDCHLGDYMINFELNNMNNFLIVMNKLYDTFLLTHTAEFRPYIQPLTNQDKNDLEKHLKKPLTPQQLEAFHALKHLVVQDYFRLLLYTNLFRKYKRVRSIDVRRRLIWKFKKTSLIYQLVMGKTLQDVLREEKDFFKAEKSFNEKLMAIQLNEKLIFENLFKIEEGNSYFDLYMRNIKTIERWLSAYELSFKITGNFSMNLYDVFGNKEKPERELELSLKSMVLTLTKPRGPLVIDLNFDVQDFQIKFSDDVNSNSKISISPRAIQKFISEVNE